MQHHLVPHTAVCMIMPCVAEPDQQSTSAAIMSYIVHRSAFAFYMFLSSAVQGHWAPVDRWTVDRDRFTGHRGSLYGRPGSDPGRVRPHSGHCILVQVHCLHYSASINPQCQCCSAKVGVLKLKIKTLENYRQAQLS